MPASAAEPERAFVHPLARIGETRQVAAEHLVISEQMVAERHRLRDLQMGEARHDRVGMLLGALDQHALQAADRIGRLVAGIAHPKAEVGRDLVVARARGVQPPGRFADQLAEAVLDGHVDVLELGALGNTVPLIFAGDDVEPLEDRRRVGLADDPLVAKHRRMRLRGRDVLAPQALVEADRGVDLAHQRRRRVAETPAPGPLRWRLLAHAEALPRQAAGGQTGWSP